MKEIRDYGAADWLRFRPLTQAYKTARYRATTAWYVRQNSSDLAPLIDRLRQTDATALAVTIAFENAWAIQQQIAGARRFLNHATLVVCDNSKSPDGASAIAAACRASGTHYLRLPHNPTTSASRSHALAMNWAYRNLVGAVRPHCFAFLDHDLLPLADIDLARHVEQQPFYGRLRQAEGLWFLWAGYCIFGQVYADGLSLDFSQDWFIGLDTGGRNYRRLYRKYDRSRLAFAHTRLVEHRDPLTGASLCLEQVDDWLHLGNASGWDKSQKRDEGLLRRVVENVLREPAEGAAGGDDREPANRPPV